MDNPSNNNQTTKRRKLKGDTIMKQTKQIVKDLIEQGITNPDEIAKRSGLSKNRVYELRKELGYSKKQLKKLGLEKKTQTK